MKKTYYTIALIFMLVFVGCSNEDNDVSTSSQPQTFNLIVSATRETDNDALSRSLSLHNKTVTSTWTENDEVAVYNSSDVKIGTLRALSSGVSTSLSGNLSKAPSVGESLTLRYQNPNYQSQDGTLTGSETSIDKVCDYATATVVVNSVDMGAGTITTTGASFTNNQAIVRFYLNNTAGDAMSVQNLYIDAGGTTINVTPSSKKSVIYVAIPGFANKNVTLVGYTGSNYAEYTRNNVTFVNGRYYTRTVEMTASISNIASIKAMLNGGVDCSQFHGRRINSSGELSNSNPIGYIAYMSTENVDEHLEGSRILVISKADAGTSIAWGDYGNFSDETTGYDGLNSTTNMNGRDATYNMYVKGSSIFPAAYAAWTYSASRPNGATEWFVPSYAQWNAILNSCSGNTDSAKRSALNTMAGLSSTKYYWSSTQYYANEAYFLSTSLERWKKNVTTDRNVRPCFAY